MLPLKLLIEVHSGHLGDFEKSFKKTLVGDISKMWGNTHLSSHSPYFENAP